MNLMRMIELSLLKVMAIGTILGYLLPRILPQNAPKIMLQNPFVSSILSACVLFIVYVKFIYPKYRDPLRHLPVVTDRKGATILESPRGASALRWMRQHPDDQLIRISGGLGLKSIILCSGPDALRDILNTRVYDFEKPWGVRAFLARAIGWGLILSEGFEHKKQKKILTPAFHVPRIRMLYGLMWEKTQILLQSLDADVKKNANGYNGAGVVEISKWSSRLTLDIIGPAAMGRDFKSLTIEANPIADAFLELLRPSPERLIFLGLHWILPEYIIRRLPLKTNVTLNRIGGYLRDTCNDIIHEKKRELAERKGALLADFDILSRIMQTGEFSDQELINQMLTFLAAGHETTASALTWTCYLCAKYPELQKKLRAEIHQYIPSSTTTNVGHEVFESMPYLHGVCEETLRLYPTVPATVREAVRDTEVAGFRVPKSTDFVLVPYAINRHPNFWGHDSDRMVPERWIDKMDDGTTRPNKTGGTSTNFSELTFLHGPRACIGRDFAKAELRCAVAGVIGKFEIELLEGMGEPMVTGVITMKPEGGMHLRLRPIASW